MKKFFAKIKDTQKKLFAEINEFEFLREVFGLLFILVAILTLLSLLSFNSNDSSFFTTNVNAIPKNLGGSLGAKLSSALYLAFGFASFIIVALFAWFGGHQIFRGSLKASFGIASGAFIAMVITSAIFDKILPLEEIYLRGGIVGNVLYSFFGKYLGTPGAFLFFFFVLVSDAVFIFRFSIKEYIERVRGNIKNKLNGMHVWAENIFSDVKEKIDSKREDMEKAHDNVKETETSKDKEVYKEKREFYTDDALREKTFSKEQSKVSDKKIKNEKEKIRRVSENGPAPFFKKRTVGPLGQRTFPFIEKVKVKEVVYLKKENEDEASSLSKTKSETNESKSKRDYCESDFSEIIDEMRDDDFSNVKPAVTEVPDLVADDEIVYPNEEVSHGEKIRHDEIKENNRAESFGIDLDILKKKKTEFNETVKEDSAFIKENENKSFNEETNVMSQNPYLETDGNAALDDEAVFEQIEGYDENDSSFSNAHSEIDDEVEEFNKTERILVNRIQNNYDPDFVSKNYKGPSIDHLKKSIAVNDENFEATIRETAERLEKTLSDFNVSARVVGVSRGPVITRYELEIAAGTKVSKIVGLTDNIALALASESVRIIAPIPGRSVIGIEIPNKVRKMVFLRDILESDDAKKCDADIPVALGKGIYGNNIIFDMAAAPHLLVAGTTGSGKSVCLSTIILSLLYKFRPDELKFIFIDKKRVELSIYNGVPHLMAPVVSDDKKATVVLRHIVEIMEKRYEKMEKFYVRTVKAYNEKVRELLKEGETEFEGEALELFPYIVVVLDELHNLMVVASKEVEDLISRLAGMSRAVGIHLVIATQRPSADVVTGVIKANLPTRVAFQVPNKSNSRIIIDMGGAEQLLGKGDALFCSPSSQMPERVQGAFVSDAEVKRVVDDLAKQMQPVYDEEVIEMLERDEDDVAAYDSSDEDDMWDDAVNVVLSTRRASASFLQRRLKIGYNRAARIIEIMEQRGIIGPENGSKPREVLIGDISGA